MPQSSQKMKMKTHGELIENKQRTYLRFDQLTMREIEIAKELDRYPVVNFAHKLVWARRSIVQKPTISARLVYLAITYGSTLAVEWPRILTV
jgi:hypothetical protein